ncbi:hypothetical protein BDR26DRAFT_1009025 [Obelidium mucronatum]|nr:hypothetical protein BDR26DRAFT_1009025 [Obelidium mucronatum]
MPPTTRRTAGITLPEPPPTAKETVTRVEFGFSQQTLVNAGICLAEQVHKADEINGYNMNAIYPNGVKPTKAFDWYMTSNKHSNSVAGTIAILDMLGFLSVEQKKLTNTKFNRMGWIDWFDQIIRHINSDSKYEVIFASGSLQMPSFFACDGSSIKDVASSIAGLDIAQARQMACLLCIPYPTSTNYASKEIFNAVLMRAISSKYYIWPTESVAKSKIRSLAKQQLSEHSAHLAKSTFSTTTNHLQRIQSSATSSLLQNQTLLKPIAREYGSPKTTSHVCHKLQRSLHP